MVRKLRRLPWAANEAYLVRCLIGAARARVSSAPLAASLGAGLAHYHPSLGVALADAVLEEVRSHQPCLQQAQGGLSGATQELAGLQRGRQAGYTTTSCWASHFAECHAWRGAAPQAHGHARNISLREVHWVDKKEVLVFLSFGA